MSRSICLTWLLLVALIIITMKQKMKSDRGLKMAFMIIWNL